MTEALQRDQAEISADALTALTAREREVALLVVDGCSDRQIAQRPYLSPLTISQYVKRIYRKLDVSSRVALTRLLIDPRGPATRPIVRCAASTSSVTAARSASVARRIT
jgi:DNA-binding NarL/FixJ family response regulator